MNGVQPLRLALFFTRGNSLATWERLGSLERELAVYRRLVQRGVNITLVTYGGAEEAPLAASLSGFEVCYNTRGLPLPVYELLLPWLHRKSLRLCSVYKTNQVKGAHTALFAGLLWRKPVVVRAGYLWAESLAQVQAGSHKARLARIYQYNVMQRAARIIVTTPLMRQGIVSQVPSLEDKTFIVPNYVDTGLFSPAADEPGNPVDLPEPANRIIFIGRLVPEKDPALLIRAMQGLEASLTVVGDGPLSSDLAALAIELGVTVHWLKRVPNTNLPGMLRESSVYVISSQFEGQPKSLLEAMACGIAVVGTNVTGIREIIRHNETGWLCAPEPSALHEALRTLLADPQLRQRLGSAARQDMLERFGLDHVVELEESWLRELAGAP